MDEPSIASTLLHVMQLTTQEDILSDQALSDLGMATAMTIELAKNVTTSQDLRHKILHLLSTNELLAPLQAFTKTVKNYYRQGNEIHVHGTCLACYTANRHILQHRFCFLILQTALHAAENEMSVEPWLTTALLKKQMSIGTSPTACNRASMRKDLTVVSLFEAKSTPEEMPSHAWRDPLMQCLSRDAGYQHQSVVKIVSEVCRDLEARCEDAERPYREEQTRAHDLERKLKASEDRTVELQVQNEDSLNMIHELKTEKSQLKERADWAESRVQSMSSDAETLRKVTDDTISEATRKEGALLEAARKRDLLYLATLTGKDEELKKKGLIIDELESERNVLRDDLAQSTKTAKKGADEIKRLEAESARRCDELNKAVNLQTERRKEVESLSEAKSSLVAENESALSKVCHQPLTEISSTISRQVDSRPSTAERSFEINT